MGTILFPLDSAGRLGPEGTLISRMQTVAGVWGQDLHAVGNGKSLGNTLHLWLWVLCGGVFSDACETC